MRQFTQPRVLIVRRLIVFTFVVVCLGALTFGRPVAQSRPAAPQAPLPTAVRPTLDTYTVLERQATRVTSRFPDAIAIATRDAHGTLAARVTDVAGNELATVVIDGPDLNVRTMNFTSADGRRSRMAAPADVRSTLEWANRQVYRWLKGAAAAPNLDDGLQEVKMEFAGGFLSKSRRTAGARKNIRTGDFVQGHGITSRLLKDDMEVGASEWFAEEQAFEWAFRGLTEGYIDAERLDKTGGWPFTPDLAWINVQNYAFYQFHTAVKQRGFVAGVPRLLDRLTSVLVPSLFANEAGCDDLHWLDSSIYRPCCDIHDQCYEKYGCSSSSWWQWWSSWRCDTCNAFAVFCFATKSQYGPFYPSPY